MRCACESVSSVKSRQTAYPTADQAVNVYDALIDAGKDLGLKRAGYHALDSLRSEKGYRHLGHDIRSSRRPL